MLGRRARGSAEKTKGVRRRQKVSGTVFVFFVGFPRNLSRTNTNNPTENRSSTSLYNPVGVAATNGEEKRWQGREKVAGTVFLFFSGFLGYSSANNRNDPTQNRSPSSVSNPPGSAEPGCAVSPRGWAVERNAFGVYEFVVYDGKKPMDVLRNRVAGPVVRHTGRAKKYQERSHDDRVLGRCARNLLELLRSPMIGTVIDEGHQHVFHANLSMPAMCLDA